jgi:hypothetical protein
MNRGSISAITAIALLSITACQKDKDDVSAPGAAGVDYTAATDQAMAADYSNDMMEQVDAAALANGVRSTDDACDPTITLDTIAMPHTMTIDFGNVNCTAANGRMRRGILHVTFTGPYHAPGTVITITTQDYYVNNNHVEGTKTVSNMGLNADHLPYFNVVSDLTVIAGNGNWTATHHAERVRTWVQGADTPDHSDDAYVITGHGHGVNRNGNAYVMNIENPLHVHAGCPFITQGVVTVTPENQPARTIDYGDGSCDNTATVTVNGQSFTITLG